MAIDETLHNYHQNAQNTATPGNVEICDIMAISPSDAEICDVMTISPSDAEICDVMAISPSDAEICDVMVIAQVMLKSATLWLSPK